MQVAQDRQCYNEVEATKVGMHTADKADLRMDEMNMLFAPPEMPDDSEVDES